MNRLGFLDKVGEIARVRAIGLWIFTQIYILIETIQKRETNISSF